jgi:NAD(P)-dependent dehydrogenase (short-subunit alcohol dehydrogenase family)
VAGLTALVTGAGQVGRAIATTLAAHGASPVVITDLYAAPLEQAADAIRDAGSEPITVVADITQRSSGADLLAATAGLARPVQILVNNAGMPPGYFGGGGASKFFVDTTPQEWEPVIRLNLYGSCTSPRRSRPP